MSYNFPANPAEGDEYAPPIGGQTYVYKTPRWLVKGIPPAGGGSGGGMEEAPTDGQQYARQSAAWTAVIIPPGTWASITGKPSTFPPTLPIAQSDVTGLVAGQSAQDTAISGKEPTITAGITAQYWRGDKSWQTLDKAAVGLPNVDNTSDANKPVSSATTTALNLKEDKANKGVANGYASLDATAKVPAAQLPSYVDDVLEYASFAAFPGPGTAGVIYVALDTGKIYRWSGSAYVEISPSPGSTDAVPEGSTNLYFTNGRASAAAPVQSVNTRTGAIILTKADVALPNVDNTSDISKPISAATQTALDGKENTIVGGTTAQYWRGDKSWQNFPASEPPINAGTTSQYYRGDKSWQILDKAAVGLAAVDNTSDVNKPVSTAQAAANALKVNKAGDTMTGDLTVNGVIKGSTGSFQSQDVNVLLCTTGAGNVYLRPNGYGSTTGQFVVASDGTVTPYGPVVLPADPTTAMQAVTKQYADTKVSDAGDTMTGLLVLSADPSAALGAATKQYVDTLKNIMLAFPWPGKPLASGMLILPMTLPVTIPAALAGTVGFTNTNGTASKVFTLNKLTSTGTSTALGTITVPAATKSAFTLAGAGGSLVAGDSLQMVAPAAQDTTLSDISFTIKATRT